MIKKSVFEDEIISNMEQELRPLRKQAAQDVSNAIDYLNNAAEIFEEAGLTAQADKIVAILSKIAQPKTEAISVIKLLMDAGDISEKDFRDFTAGSQFAKAKVNQALKDAGFNEANIAQFIGEDNVLSQSEIEELLGPKSSLRNILKMIEDPMKAVPGKSPRPGEEVEISSIASKKANDPRRISDPHTKGLTPDKMVKNLLHHGTEFNMADDGFADDLLSLEFNDTGLEVSEDEHNPEMDFEDEI